MEAQIIPAVDLMDGKVVRLLQGDPRALKAYWHLGDPVTVAKRWEEYGADALHIIDLDAALDRGNNLDIIKKIAQEVRIPVQVGGGIRTLEAAQNLLRAGINRIIVGSLAFKDSSAMKELLEEFGSDRVVVALDHRNGEVMVQGWRTATKRGVGEAMERFLNFGANLFLITSITRDGTLQGPDYGLIAEACKRSGVRVIAAGGVSNIEDLIALKEIGVWGVVIGKALYEGVFDLREAVRVMKGG
jgi:phosphoribosylformimino-5-aminoimidazole carboxamide ribotide isomerase